MFYPNVLRNVITLFPSRMIFIAIAIVLGLSACQTDRRLLTPEVAEMIEVQGEGTDALGPDRAVGVILFHPGRDPLEDIDEDEAWVPYYLRSLNAKGWDVYRANLPQFGRMGDEGRSIIADSMIISAERRRTQGYRKVVLAGQSFGGWNSLFALTKFPDRASTLDAVIATAPATFGNDVGIGRNAGDLYQMLQQVPTGVPLFLAFFRGDDFSYQDRGPTAQEILSRRSVDNLVVSESDPLLGHGAGALVLFDTLYGACLAQFLINPALDQDCPIQEDGDVNDPSWMYKLEHLTRGPATLLTGEALRDTIVGRSLQNISMTGSRQGLVINEDGTADFERLEGARRGTGFQLEWSEKAGSVCFAIPDENRSLCRWIYQWDEDNLIFVDTETRLITSSASFIR